MPQLDPFSAYTNLELADGSVGYWSLAALERAGLGPMAKLPYSIRILLEAVLRNVDDRAVERKHVEALANWSPTSVKDQEIPFKCARVVLQDFTGVPALVDLAAMRSAMQRLGGDPAKINPVIPADLVIDHSVQVDHFGSQNALALNAKIEFERNRERYEFLRWGQKAFDNFRVVPPATGIVHQVNLEYLATAVVRRTDAAGRDVAFPDTLVGTDSHTTMINGLGVLGWGVGGIEAEAAMLGQPIYMLIPEVVGFRLTGKLAEGATATDLVLRVTQMLRKQGVVGKFVEFFGEGLSSLTLPDRATIANMAPEYGATCGFFPIDARTLEYLRFTGRPADVVELVEKYTHAQGLFRTDDATDPHYTNTLELDLATVEPALAGPKRPQDRIALSDMQTQWRTDLERTFGKSVAPASRHSESWAGEGGAAAAATAVAGVDTAGEGVDVSYNGAQFKLQHGDVVIAAITSCTNTSNPSVMVAAGLVAKKARALGLNVKPWVKTSLAPGSRVVTDYLAKAALDDDLDALGFQTVGYGCTTCIGNSGPLPDEIGAAIEQGDLVVSSVLSGNRNFEARIHPLIKANYLASPPLVVAYALAGTTDIDLQNDPLGEGANGPVQLRDIWPTQKEIADTIAQCVTPEMFERSYADVFKGDELWRGISTPESKAYEWKDESTYIQEPPFFQDLAPQAQPITPVNDARCLVMVGDSVTTDHISPAGAIKPDSPAGQFLQERGVQVSDFNSYGSRRGNDRVMTRGTFANVRLRNLLAPGTEGGVTTYLPDGQQMSIYEASRKYLDSGTPLVVLAGDDYGMGSSRDWAAKGTLLLGVRAVIAQSYERIHRTNLVCMGVLPLQFKAGEGREQLGLTGHEFFDIPDLDDNLQPGQMLKVIARTADGGASQPFDVHCRIDTAVEVDYYRNGGVLQTVLREMNTQK